MDPVNLSLNLSGQLPGEQIIVALLNYATKFRETMAQENRDAFDKVQASMLKGWVNWWVDRGWPGEKV